MYRSTKLVETDATTSSAPSFSVSSLFFFSDHCSRQPFHRVPVRMPDAARRAELKRPSERGAMYSRAAVSVAGTAASGAASSVKAVVACSPRVARRRRGDGSPTTIFMDNWRALGGEISSFARMSSISQRIVHTAKEGHFPRPPDRRPCVEWRARAKGPSLGLSHSATE